MEDFFLIDDSSSEEEESQIYYGEISLYTPTLEYFVWVRVCAEKFLEELGWKQTDTTFFQRLVNNKVMVVRRVFENSKKPNKKISIYYEGDHEHPVVKVELYNPNLFQTFLCHKTEFIPIAFVCDDNIYYSLEEWLNGIKEQFERVIIKPQTLRKSPYYTQ